MSSCQVKFSTLSEYFDAVRAELGDNRSNESVPEGRFTLPTLSGDFFTYADAPEHYWAGFYTSRPQLKLACAQLHAAVRALDVIQAIAIMRQSGGEERWQQRGGNKEPSPSRLDKNSFIELFRLAANISQSARREAALLLHHDTITGTSTDWVVEDVYKRCM